MGVTLLSFAKTTVYLQVGVYKKYENANRLLKRLETATPYPVAIKEVGGDKHPSFVVMIGGFYDREDAQNYQRTLKREGIHALLREKIVKGHVYDFSPSPIIEAQRVSNAEKDLNAAIDDPEYLLKHDIHLPTSPKINNETPFFLSLRDAIFLSLRYNTQLQSAELDRIVQRYAVRMAKNKFEFQFGLDGAGNWDWGKDLGVNKATTQSLNLTPSIGLNSRYGTSTKVGFMNNYDGFSYAPQLTLAIKQPLLRGFGKTVTEQTLNDQLDSEISNKLGMKQAVIDRVTDVISAYRLLIQQNNTLNTQVKSLKDAQEAYRNNKKNIEAGTLPPKGNIQQAFQISYLETSLESQENALIQTRQRLLTAIGLDPNMKVRVPSDVSVNHLRIPNLKDTLHQALLHNTAYLQAQVTLRQNKRAYEVVLKKQRWQLDFSANITTGGSAITNADSTIKRILTLRNNGAFNAFINRLFNEGTNGEQLGLTFSVPLRDVTRRSEVIQAKVTLEKSRLSLFALRRTLETNIINSINSIKTQVRLYNMTLRQVALAKESYALELKKQEAGIASAIEVTNTQDQLIKAQNSLIGAKIAYLNEMTKLEQTLGTTLEVWKMNLRFL